MVRGVGEEIVPFGFVSVGVGREHTAIVHVVEYEVSELSYCGGKAIP